MNLTTRLVPTYEQMLRGLSAWLEKARTQTSEADAKALLASRLAPDMYPLATQIRFACYQAQEATYRLRGLEIPETLAALAKEGQIAGAQPGSMDDAQARISEALAFLENLTPDILDDGAERKVSINLPDGMIFDMTGDQFARDWALAQFYFHIVTAYAILSSQGIDLGKADYVAHMFAYLRPGTMPPS